MIKFYYCKSLMEPSNLIEEIFGEQSVKEQCTLCANEKCVYTVYCKEGIGELYKINFLKTAFIEKTNVYEYVIKKIDQHLEKIKDIYQSEHINKCLPIHSSLIYTLYNNIFDDEERYNYFLSNYKEFYRGLSIEPIMFFISKHKIK